LIGFAIWERRDGGGRNVTFPARQYAVNGKGRSRFSGFGQAKNWVVADFVRVVDGMLAEHWDVVEDEASRAESKSGRPMFGDRFPA